MVTLLHISDLHVGPPFLSVIGDAAVRAAHELEPDILVMSGDFTQRARAEQYAAAAAFMKRMPAVPTVVVPGNHDIPLYRVFERVFAPYRLYRQFISARLDNVLVHEEAVIVSLNSTKPLQAITNGRISEAQLDFCEAALRDVAPGVARLVVVHHHLAPAPDYEGGQVMPGAKRAVDRFKKLKVDLVLGGHLHRAYIGNSLDLYPGVDREHGIIIVQSGTTTSRRGRAREREKNSFNLVRIGETVVRITHYMYFDELEGFAPVSRHIFPRPGRAYLQEGAGIEESMALAPPVGVPGGMPSGRGGTHPD